ncbi:TetR/AcrR family transcriptional regulator [Propionibacteriaceae bacterium Y2011]
MGETDAEGAAPVRDTGSGNGVRRDRRTTDTRQRIQATALDLFTTRGYGGTSLKDIADELGVTKAAVYYHFPAKADLAHSIFGPFIADVDAMFDAFDDNPPGPRDAMARYLDTMIPHRQVFAAMARDPGAVSDVDLGEVGRRWIQRMSDILIGQEPSPDDRVRVGVALGGLIRALLVDDVDVATIRRVGLESAMAALASGR